MTIARSEKTTTFFYLCPTPHGVVPLNNIFAGNTDQIQDCSSSYMCLEFLNSIGEILLFHFAYIACTNPQSYIRNKGQI